MRRPVAIALAALVFCLLAVAAAYQYLSRDYGDPGPSSAEKILVIPKGDGLTAIAERLKTAGLIRSATRFALEVRLFAGPRPLRAGEYAFPDAVSPAGIVALLQDGKVVIHRVTVPEGFTSREIIELLAATEPMDGPVPDDPAEGTLLPETYNYIRGDPREDVVRRMARAMSDTVDAIWEKRADNLPLKDRRDLVILASIIERETAVAAERPLVAGVYINRLRKGMRLQADPTAAYGIGIGTTQPARPLTRADLAVVNPYNTYQIDGLPRGPIANPGRAALEAAARPAKTDALFFVADGEGGHRFAKTLDEHNRNVAAFRKRQRAGEAP